MIDQCTMNLEGCARKQDYHTGIFQQKLRKTHGEPTRSVHALT
jgi:hypothetical protein